MIKHKNLTKEGYVLKKDDISDKRISTVKKDLTVKPKMHPDYTDDITPFKVFRETDNSLTLPRYYGRKKFGKPLEEFFPDNPVNISFKGSLRQKQMPIFESCLKDIKEKGGGIISLHCGAGKTVLALRLAVELGVKTLVVVHKTFLQNQWYDRIKQFTDASVGMIRQKKVDTKDKDIVVGMLQSISMIDYPEETFDQFGLVIYDECHHAASRVFSQALMKTRTKYTIGLSATPNRKDGLTKILNWYLGDVIYKLERKGDNKVLVKNFMYESNSKFFVEKKKWFKGRMRPAVQTMITDMHKSEFRNAFITNIINALKEQYERKILILSHRLDHLDKLKAMLDKVIEEQEKTGKIDASECKTAKYIGGMKALELEVSAEADIIFATYAMAAEGLDIDKLNTLILATPAVDVVQSVGRIMRKPTKEGGICPMIIDITDDFSCFPGWGNKRMAYYRKKKYEIETFRAYNKDCISVKTHLLKHGVITKEEYDNSNFDIRKKSIIHEYGEDHYILERDFGFKDHKIERYTYEPNLSKIFAYDYGEPEEDDENKLPDDIFKRAVMLNNKES